LKSAQAVGRGNEALFKQDIHPLRPASAKSSAGLILLSKPGDTEAAKKLVVIDNVPGLL